MVEQSPFTSGQAPLLDLAPEPFVVADRILQQVQCDLVDRTPALGGQARQLCFEFPRHP